GPLACAAARAAGRVQTSTCTAPRKSARIMACYRFRRPLFSFNRLALALVAASSLTSGFAAESKMPACAGARESSLPLPSAFSRNNNPAAYQKVLSDFLEADTYESLGWCSDKSLRDTGPFIEGTYYGTHPVV